jgi:hypothetical protein
MGKGTQARRKQKAHEREKKERQRLKAIADAAALTRAKKDTTRTEEVRTRFPDSPSRNTRKQTRSGDPPPDPNAKKQPPPQLQGRKRQKVSRQASSSKSCGNPVIEANVGDDDNESRSVSEDDPDLNPNNCRENGKDAVDERNDEDEDNVADGEGLEVANGGADVEEERDGDVCDSSEDDDGEDERDEEPLTPKQKQDGRVTRVRIAKHGEQKYWMTNTRKFVQDALPYAKKRFILYVAQSPVETDSSIMLERDPNLQEMAVRRGGVKAYALAKAQLFNLHHKKAKTQLNRSIVLGLTTDLSDYQIAVNVMNGKDGPMRLHESMSHLPDIAALIDLFNSDRLYTDSVLHAKWVGLFTSGVIYGMQSVPPTTKLVDVIDINYEAHARYEMVSRLSYQGFHHSYKHSDLADRAKGFRLIRKKVRRDRLQHLAAAEEKRLAGVRVEDGDANRQLELGSGGLADTSDEEDSDGF